MAINTIDNSSVLFHCLLTGFLLLHSHWSQKQTPQIPRTTSKPTQFIPVRNDFYKQKEFQSINLSSLQCQLDHIHEPTGSPAFGTHASLEKPGHGLCFAEIQVLPPLLHSTVSCLLTPPFLFTIGAYSFFQSQLLAPLLIPGTHPGGTCTQRHLCVQTNCQHIQQNRSGLHLLRKASLHRGHSSVLLYYKNTQSKYFHEQLEGSKTYTANALFIQKGNTENKTNPSYGGNLNIS